MWTRNQLKEQGKLRFAANYWPAVLGAICVLISTASSGGAGKNSKDAVDSISSNPLIALAAVIFTVIVALISIIITLTIKIFLLNPLSVGGYRLYVENHDGHPSCKTVLFAFRKDYYMNIVKIMFLRDLYVLIGFIIFIIPGVIKSYEYRMIPFLVAENPYISVEEAFTVTKGMMTGNKMDAFLLDLSFFGWYILVGLTGGILGIFYVNPYWVATNTELYFTLKYM